MVTAAEAMEVRDGEQRQLHAAFRQALAAARRVADAFWATRRRSRPRRATAVTTLRWRTAGSARWARRRWWWQAMTRRRRCARRRRRSDGPRRQAMDSTLADGGHAVAARLAPASSRKNIGARQYLGPHGYRHGTFGTRAVSTGWTPAVGVRGADATSPSTWRATLRRSSKMAATRWTATAAARGHDIGCGGGARGTCRTSDFGWIRQTTMERGGHQPPLGSRRSGRRIVEL